jgi:hypothetical protein
MIITLGNKREMNLHMRCGQIGGQLSFDVLVVVIIAFYEL